MIRNIPQKNHSNCFFYLRFYVLLLHHPHAIQSTIIWTRLSSETGPGSFLWLQNVSHLFLCGGSPLLWMVRLLFEESVFSVEISPILWWSILCEGFTYSMAGPLLCWGFPCYVEDPLLCMSFLALWRVSAQDRAHNSPSLVYGSTNVIALWSLIRRSNAPQSCELPENKDNAQVRVWLRNQAQEK